jgi:ATP-dependent exoDNAse (exonuclease V) alpha subunit
LKLNRFDYLLNFFKCRNSSDIPLRVAYAITIHKSQGLTLECAFVDITGKNEHGQVFVAFSRVKEVKDLILKGFGKPRYKRIAQKRKDSKLRQVKKTLEFIEKRAAHTKKVLKKVGF